MTDAPMPSIPEVTLLPCPFCGGEAFVNTRYGVSCEKVFCASMAVGVTSASSIAAWNCRTPHPVAAEGLIEREAAVVQVRVGHNDEPFPFPMTMNERAKRNHGGQTLARLEERGGLCWAEAYWIINDIGWSSKKISEPDAEREVRNFFATRPPVAVPGEVGLRRALYDLQAAEASYRDAHDHYGGSHAKTGRAWDLMRRAGDRARTALKDHPTDGGRDGQG